MNTRNAAAAAGCAAILLASAFAQGAQPGAIDAAFGTAGKVSTNINATVPVFGEGRSVAVQADGKYVVCGDSTEGSVQHYALLRYNADGSLDATFGTGGLVRTLTLGGLSLCNQVAIQADQKIVAVGFNDANSNDFVVVRYTTTGALDPTFGTGGVTTAHFGTGLDRANDVKIQSDGKIVVVGQVATASNGRDFGVIRLNTDGTFDSGFGSAGRATVTISTGTDDARGVAIDSLGRIVLVGRSGTLAAIARLNANGTLDTSFASPAGFLTLRLDNNQSCTYFGGPSEFFNGVAILPGDKIIAAGSSNSLYHNDALFGVRMTQMAFFQFNANGTTDTSFGPGGYTSCVEVGAPSNYFPPMTNTTPGLVLVQVNPGAYNGGQSAVRRVHVTAAGKIVGTGYADYDGTGQTDYAAVRLNANGSLDTSFGCAAGTGCTGKASIDLNGQGRADQSVGGLLDASGRVVMTGYSYVNPSDVSTPLVGTLRLTTNGVLDTSFNGTGIIFTQMYGGSQDIANALAVQADGKPLMGGLTQFGSSFDFAITRYTTAGALDASFASGGKFVFNSTGSANDTVQALAVRADGAIFAAGQAGADVAVLKLSSAGVLDTSFGTSGIARATFAGTGAEAKALALQPDDKIVVAGINYPGGTDDAIVVRFTSAGALDSTFGGGTGKVTFNWGSGTFDEIYALALQTDGKIVVAGRTTAPPGGTYFKIALARLTTAGVLDTTFGCIAGTGCTGLSVTSISSGSNEAYSVGILPDGKIVVGGKSNTVSGTNDFMAARFLANGTLDPSFGTSGYSVIPLMTDANDQSTGMLARVDGRVILFGSFFNFGTDDFAVMVLNRDGNLDTSFNANGTATTSLSYNDFSSKIAQTADGQFFLSGSDGGAADFLLTRMYSPTHEPAYFRLVNDTGRSSSDTITNATLLNITGTCFRGTTVQLTVNSANMSPSQTCAANDTFNITFTGGLADGTHSIGGLAFNALTGWSTNTYVLTVTIDTVPPAAPAITTPAAGADFPVNGTVSGTAEANAIVRVREGATVICTATANVTGAWSCAMNVAVGSHTFNANAEDVAGNVGANSTSVTFTAKYPTLTGVQSNLNPSTYGQSVGFTAIVLQSAGGPGASGSVQFSVDGVAFGSPVSLQTFATNASANLNTSALAGGTRSITVAYLGSSTHLPSSSGILTQTVNKAAQTITFGALGAKVLGDPAFGVSATASSSLAVAFTSTTPTICTTSGTNGATVTLQAPGACTIAANQAGDGNYLAAPQVTQTFTVKRRFNVVLEGGQEVPVNASPANGTGTVTVDTVAKTLAYTFSYSGLTGTYSMAHFHGPGGRGISAGVKIDLTANPTSGTVTYLVADEPAILGGNWYFNVHTNPNFAGGEIRGQLDDIGATQRFLLTVSKAGSGAGTVTSMAGTIANSINCGATCGYNAPSGLQIVLTATPVAGTTFTGWSGGGCSGTGTCSVTMNAAATVTATFELNRVLTVTRAGAGTGTVTGTGISCPGDCTETVASGTIVALTAHASGGSYFNGWTGGGCSGQGTCNVTVSSDVTVTATFVLGGPDVTSVDFNNDGRSDILIRDSSNGVVYGWLMNGLAIATGGYMLDAGSGWAPVRVVDLNGDGKADLLIQHTDGSLYAWIMDGLTVTGGGYLLGAGSGWSVSHIGDFNGDGKGDILLKHTDGSIYVWLMDGFNITSGTYLQGASTGWTATHVADFNGDGKSDVLLTHTDGSIYVWQMNGIAIQTGAFLKGAGIDWSPTETGDFNGDGKDDILITHTNGGVYLWQMNGIAIQTGAYLLSPASGWSIAKTGDLDGDGKSDIVIKHTDGSHYGWIMNGLVVSGGGYLLGASTGWSVTHLRDLNGDGKSDILLKHTDGSIYGWIMNGVTIANGAYLMGAGSWRVVPSP